MPAAEAVSECQPLAATVVLRAIINITLNGASVKRYLQLRTRNNHALASARAETHRQRRMKVARLGEESVRV